MNIFQVGKRRSWLTLAMSTPPSSIRLPRPCLQLGGLTGWFDSGVAAAGGKQEVIRWSRSCPVISTTSTVSPSTSTDISCSLVMQEELSGCGRVLNQRHPWVPPLTPIPTTHLTREPGGQRENIEWNIMKIVSHFILLTLNKYYQRSKREYRVEGEGMEAHSICSLPPHPGKDDIMMC